MTQAYVPPHELPVGEPRPGVLLRMSILVIGGLAALVSTAAYFTGRSMRPGEDASVRVTVASSAAAPTAAPAQADVEPVAPPPNPFATFELGQLEARVAGAVIEARGVQQRAMDAARRAQAASRLARAGADGAGIILGESGDTYAGELRDGASHGVGVYTWANPQEDYYAGEFADGRMDGLGVKRWADGATYYGDRRLQAREGYGVFIDPEGGGYEGAWRNGAPDGFGVLWNSDGTARSQGLWANNTLIESTAAPTPVPADGAALTADGAGVEVAAEASVEP